MRIAVLEPGLLRTRRRGLAGALEPDVDVGQLRWRLGIVVEVVRNRLGLGRREYGRLGTAVGHEPGSSSGSGEGQGQGRGEKRDPAVARSATTSHRSPARRTPFLHPDIVKAQTK